MKKIGVIDYSIGNIFSVIQACREVGLEAELVSDPAQLKDRDGLILPGVGAFGKGMENLKARGLDQGIREFIKTGRPFMGVCLGMQLLLDRSEEFGGFEGLSLVGGEVKHLRGRLQQELPVPKITWDTNVHGKSWEKTPLMALKETDDVYFVHSYYCDVKDPAHVLAKAEYGGVTYCSALLKDNIFATQFHPEKSGLRGLEIYRNWKDLYF